MVIQNLLITEKMNTEITDTVSLLQVMLAILICKIKYENQKILSA
jgi:hypothetical protein